MLRGDAVKDDSSSYAVFTEQGSSASHMTSSIVLDVIARLPGQGKQATLCPHTLMKNCRWSEVIENTRRCTLSDFGYAHHVLEDQKSWDKQTGSCGTIGKK